MLVTDACADRGRERHEAALALYGDYMYELRSVESLKRELELQQRVVEKKKKKKDIVDHSGVSSIRKVSVALPSDGDDAHTDKKMMIKSESNETIVTNSRCVHSLLTLIIFRIQN